MTTDGSLGDAPLLVSMTVHELYLAATGRDDRLAEFATVVAERADGIELFVEPSEAYMSSTYAAVSHAESFDLPIRTVHVPPLGVYEEGLDGQWTVEWNTHLKEILLNYEQGGTLPEEEQSYPDQRDIRRIPKMEPSVATTHPPRFPTDAETPLSDARSQLVEAFRDTLDHVTSERFAAAPLDLPTISVENVCPRPGFDYLLTSPDDVERLRDVASAKGETGLLAFTCDVGHAAKPVEMLAAMESPASVHLHGVSDAYPDDVVERLPGNVSPSALVAEPADGSIQHLPPNAFPDRTKSAIDWLTNEGHRCPLTVELQRPCKTPAIARELFEWFDGVR